VIAGGLDQPVRYSIRPAPLSTAPLKPVAARKRARSRHSMDKSKCAAMKPDHMAASGPLAISAAPQSCMEPPSPRVPIINACARADACACTRVSFLFFSCLGYLRRDAACSSWLRRRRCPAAGPTRTSSRKDRDVGCTWSLSFACPERRMYPHLGCLLR
jgi:hypothetical protein